MTAMMLPSLSLNHAAFAPPAVIDAARALLAGHVVVLERHAARRQLGDLALDVVDRQNAWLARDVPALGVGYRKHAVPLPNS